MRPDALLQPVCDISLLLLFPTSAWKVGPSVFPRLYGASHDGARELHASGGVAVVLPRAATLRKSNLLPGPLVLRHVATCADLLFFPLAKCYFARFLCQLRRAGSFILGCDVCWLVSLLIFLLSVWSLPDAMLSNSVLLHLSDTWSSRRCEYVWMHSRPASYTHWPPGALAAWCSVHELV